MVSSIALFTTLTALAARSANAMAVQSIMQGSNCLRVGNNPDSAASITSGSAVTLGECNNNNPSSAVFTGQQWLVALGNNEGLTLYGTGLCLDAGSDTPNQNIVVNTCNGSPSQTWWATEDNRIAITGGTQCLEGEGSQATTGACAPGIANQAFTYNLLFDTETATELVPGATSTDANGVIGVGGATSSAANSVSSAINSLQSSASSAIASLTSGAVASASSVVNSASSAASAATASASSVVAGAASGASSGVASATGAIGSAASSASSALGGAASSASSGAAGATTSAGDLVSSLQSVAATITSGADAAASSITPGNAAVSDFHLSKIALLFSAVAIGAAMVI